MIFFDDNTCLTAGRSKGNGIARCKKMNTNGSSNKGMNKKKLIKADFFATGRSDKNKNTSDFYMATGLHFLLKPHNRQTGYLSFIQQRIKSNLCAAKLF